MAIKSPIHEMILIETKEDNFDDPPNSSSESEFDSEPPYSSDSDLDSDYDYNNNDDVRIVIGHIPILMEPCNEFDWNMDEFMTIKSFKKHFLTCKKCIKTDNNECSVYPFVQNCLIHCDNMTDEKQIDGCFEYYHNGTPCKFELVGNDRNNNHMYVFRISLKHHIYHNTILVMW